MNKTATIITTHLPKFHYSFNFLESYIKYVEQPHDLYFIFTNEDEAKHFNLQSNFKYVNNYKPLILSESLRNKGSIVNVKKFFALNSIISEYDYVGVYDCESEFIKNCNLDLVYKDISSYDYIKANVSKIGGNIVKIAAGFMGLDTNESLIKETQNYSLYWWFNEIPVYKKELFIEFYDWYKSHPNLDVFESEYYAFDYIIYVIWLVCFKQFKIKNIELPFECEIAAIEDFRLSQEQKDVISETFQSYWSVNGANHKKYHKIKLIVHADNCGYIDKTINLKQ
jgi:hypothetical protein